MAVIDYVQTEVRSFQDYAIKVTWETLTETNSTGAPFLIAAFNTIAIQFAGTFGGGSVVLEGSIDGATYFTLDDVEGAAISKSAAGMETSGDYALWVRPRVASGTGVDVDAIMICRRA